MEGRQPAPSFDEIAEQVLDIFNGVTREQLRRDLPLIAEQGVDSLDMTEAAFDIEDLFGVEFPEHEPLMELSKRLPPDRDRNYNRPMDAGGAVGRGMAWDTERGSGESSRSPSPREAWVRLGRSSGPRGCSAGRKEVAEWLSLPGRQRGADPQSSNSSGRDWFEHEVWDGLGLGGIEGGSLIQEVTLTTLRAVPRGAE